MPIPHHSRVRLAHRRPPRRTACHPGAARRYDRLYTGLIEPDGSWSLYAGVTRLATVSGSGAPRILAAAMLADAFPGHAIRSDLIAALADDLPPDGFVVPEDLLAGWCMRWALDHPT